METTKIAVDWEGIETAAERNSPDSESYFEKSTGQVLTITRGDPQEAALLERIAAEPEAFVRIDPASSREQYRWMERFVGSVTEEPLRRRLVISIDGKGAFRRFKDVLLAYPAERERWFGYRSELLRYHIQNWIKNSDLAGIGDFPWEESMEPEELPVAPLIAQPEVSPGEALRREARDLIDGIAPMELPSAIAFLEFLQSRGQSESPVSEESHPPRPKIVR